MVGFLAGTFALWLQPFAMLQGEDAAAFPKSQSYLEQLRGEGPVKEIGLREAITEALASNLDLEVEGYNRDAARLGISSAAGYCDPIAGLNASLISSNLPTSNLLQTGDLSSLITHSWLFAPSIRENLPGGGTAALTVTLNRTSTNTDYALINPVFGSAIGLVITQPLWRGFRRTEAERQIIVSRLNHGMNESQYRQKASSVVEQVIGAYWRLAIAVESYEAGRQRRDVSVAEYEQMRKRLAAPPELASQRSEIANNERDLQLAAVQIIQAENGFKRLLAASVLDPIWNTGLLPSDKPSFEEFPLRLEEAVKTALDNRPEPAQIRMQMQQSDADIRFDRQETRPSVNLRVEAESTANAGVIQPILGDVVYPASAGLGSAYRQSLEVQHPSIAAGVEIRMPVRNTAANAQLSAAVLSRRKLQAQLRGAEEDILVDVRNAWQAVALHKKSVEAATLGRRLYDERLAAEVARPEHENREIEIQRARREAADAQVREWQALVDYRLALVAVSRAMNTILDDQHVRITDAARKSSQ